MVSTTVLAPAAVGANAVVPEIVIVAVTYNSSAIVEPFLRALPAALAGIESARVIIVDNASADDTAGLVRRIAPWVTVLDSGGNLGYGAGINVGLRHTMPSRAVYVLNPDAVPSAGSVKVLLDALESETDTGVVVPRILAADGTVYHSLRREPTIRRALGEAVLGGHRAMRYPALSEVVGAPEAYMSGAKADWATGAAMMISRPAMDRAGLWAEDFFLYSEETDYALRIRDVGLALRYVPEAEVVHTGGEMSVSPWLWSIQAVNRTRLYRRRHGLVAGRVYWAAIVLNEGIRALMGSAVHRAGLKALFTGHPALREQRRRLARPPSVAGQSS